ncbi:MAG: cytochrome P450 [Roseiflexaceae bacterium]
MRHSGGWDGVTADGAGVPGPRGLPLVGVLPQLLRDPLAFLARTAQEHGGFVRLWVGGADLYLATAPAVVKELLQERHRAFHKGAVEPAIIEIFGRGLITSDGDTWLSQRRLMQNVFHHSRLAGFATVMAEAAGRMLDGWAAMSGTPVDVSGSMARLTQEIILRTMFSTERPAEAELLARCFTTVLDFGQLAMLGPAERLTRLPTPQRRRFRQALSTLDVAVSRLIAERRASGASQPDLLSMLLETQDADTGERMSNREIRDQVFNIYLAGYETTAVLLSWACELLAHHPDVAERLRGELSALLGGRVPRFEDLPQLRYTRMVIDETLRLYPPAWLSARRPITATTLAGYPLASSATILYSPYITHRDPQLWPDPERFDPERFRPEAVEARPRFAFYPFGGGPHLCIGSHFALMEAQIVLAMLCQRFYILPASNRRLQPRVGLTLRPERMIRVKPFLYK